MKSNKSLKFQNFDFLKYFKPCLIVMLIVVLVGGIFFGVFGFNKGFDFTGGTQLVVEFNDSQIQNEQGLKDTTNKVKQILSNEGISVNSFQVQGEYYSKKFVVTFKETNESKLRNVRLEINKQLNKTTAYLDLGDLEKYKILDDEAYNMWDLTKNTTAIESFISPVATLSTISTLIFALIIVMIYALFRFKTVGALTIVFGTIIDVVLTCGFVLLARIEINTYFFGVLALVSLLSLYASVDFLYDIKLKSKEPAFSDKTNYELANVSIKSNFAKYVIIYSVAFAIALILGLFGVVNILHLFVAVIVGIACTFATHLFVTPAFWASINKKRELKPSISSLNNVDTSADVVEVEIEEDKE